ncbi:DNA polymerase III subunit gamma and tau, partial [Nocardia pseudovaccinii]|uniref:DNA polymerase III subunit gamma and tau n=1 Tax=Nocardia pseudovaccinii TaxID=189540 RepID=UPI001FE0537E
MALYRKYRPATFAEVVGQEHVTDPLSTALDTGRISHAYLFSGPRGCGKTSSARILARSLNCVQGPTSTPCGVCPSCVALGPGGPGNLDVIELDAASHGGVDDTRELRDRAFYAPAESRYRVFIVDEAHMVTTAGFNALLKIVEEPPAHLIFIFATTEPDKVLPTIRSRTHHYPFRLLPPATMRGLLGKICEQEQVPVEEAVYPLVIRAGGGSPRDSLSVLDQLLAGAGPEGVTYSRAVSLLGVTDVALIDDAIDALAAGDGAALFGTIDRVMEAGHDPRRFAVDLLERLRDLILLQAVPDAADRGLVSGPGDVLDRMREQAERTGPATLARHAELLHEGLGEMRGATAPRLLLEIVCARMLLPSVSDAESATLQRLERLERGTATGAMAPATAAAPSAPAQPDAPAQSAPPRSSNEPPRRRGAELLAAARREKDATRTGASPASAPAQAGGPAQSLPAERAAAVEQHSTAGHGAGPAGSADGPDPAVGPSAAATQTPSAAAPSAARQHSAEQGAAAGQADAGAGFAFVPDDSTAERGETQAGADRTAVDRGSSTEQIGTAESAGVDASAGTSGVPVDAASTGQARDAARSEAFASSGVESADRAAAPGRGVADPAGDSGSQAAAGLLESEGTQEVSETTAPRERDSAGVTGAGEGRAPSDSEVAQSISARQSDQSAADQAASKAGAAQASQQTGGAGASAAAHHDAAVKRSERDVADRTAAGAAQVSESTPGADSGSAGAARALARPGGAAPQGGAQSADHQGSAQENSAQAFAGQVGAEAGGQEDGDLLRAVEGAWGEIRAKVREFGPTVQALLSGASVARIEGEVIVFAHQHAPLAQRLSDPRNVEAVRSAVRAVLGSDHPIRWEAGGAAPRPAAAAPKASR